MADRPYFFKELRMEDQDKLSYEDICKIIGDLHLRSIESTKSMKAEMDSLKQVLQERIDQLVEENKALKSG